MGDEEGDKGGEEEVEEAAAAPLPPDDSEEVVELRRRIKEIAFELKAKASAVTTLEVGFSWWAS